MTDINNNTKRKVTGIRNKYDIDIYIFYFFYLVRAPLKNYKPHSHDQVPGV